jgi:integrase
MIEKRGLSVTDAIRIYLADRRTEGQDTTRIERQFEAHVLPALGATRLTDLSVPTLRFWRDRLAAAPPRLRSSKRARAEQRFAAVDLADAEVRRRRRSTVNRIATQFKAALEHAARLYPERCPSPTVWREGLRAFRTVDAPRERWLTRDQARRLVTACDPAFGRLVAAALYTGCRYGELCRARAGDFDWRAACLTVPITKAGRPRDVMLSDEAAVFFARLTADRPVDAFVFTRPAGRGRAAAVPWGPGHQARPMKRACADAGIDPPISFHGIRHTHASLAVQSGMALIALARNLGHADTRMVERHYGHLSDQYLRSQVAAHALSLDVGRQ